jgi:hypothetical protein
VQDLLLSSLLFSRSRTSGENIGDTGFIQAYRAWKAQYDTSLEAGTEYLLPGLNFTRFVHLVWRAIFSDFTNIILGSNFFSSPSDASGRGL